MRYLLLLIGMFLTSAINAGTIDPNVDDNKYLEYGADHECVFRISGVEKSGKNFLGSCVLIRPRFILTAAHIAADVDKAFVHNGSNKEEVLLFIYPEDYVANKFGGQGSDIAIGVLSNKIDIGFYPELYNKNDELDKVCSLAGFGTTGTFDTGITISDGKKRAGSNIIEKIEEYEVLVCSVQNNVWTTLEFLIATGDSGGGLFIDKKLAGIHSSVFTYGTKVPKSDRNTFSAHTRISKHKSWIEESIKFIELTIGK